MNLEAHFGDGELDAGVTLAVIDLLADFDTVSDRGRPFVGCSSLVQDRVVTIVTESIGLVFAAEPAIVETVPISVRLLNRLGEGFGNQSLNFGLFLWLFGLMQCIHGAYRGLLEWTVDVLDPLPWLVRRNLFPLRHQKGGSHGERHDNRSMLWLLNWLC